MNDKKNNKKDSAYNQDVTTNYQDTFYIIPRHIRHLEGMTLTYLDFYETCYQFWNKGRSCYLSNSIIKQRTGIKSDSRINEAFQYFEKHNVLKREYRNGKRYITPILCEVETDEGVSPERDINKEIINKENNNYVITKENDKPLVNTKSQPIATLQKINTLDLPNEFLEQLIAIRKANKASVSKLSLEAVYKELIKLKEAGFDLNECLQIYANCGWKGFIAEWFINSKAKNQSNHLDHDSMAWAEGFKDNPLYDMESYKNGR